MKNIEYLSSKGHLDRPGCAILDIGAQNLYFATPEAIKAFVAKRGAKAPDARLDAEAQRIAYHSVPRAGERTAFLAELLEFTDIAYTALDVCPAPGTELLDLNFDPLPRRHAGRFDVVLNFGTTEHIIHQANCFRVIHEALRVGGVAFHQLPSVGWFGHGYFCYHRGFFDDLARANDFEIEDLWYTVASHPEGNCLGEIDIRDPGTPLVPHSGEAPGMRVEAPSCNINVVMRKRSARAFGVGLELATAHAPLSGTIGALYQDGVRAMAERGSVEAGRALLSRLVEKASSSSAAPAVPPPSGTSAALITRFAKVEDGPLDAMACVVRARALLAEGDLSGGFGQLNRARAIVHQFPHAMLDLKPLAERYATAARQAWESGDRATARALEVVAREADPGNATAQQVGRQLDETEPGPDTTRRCYVFYDEARAETVHREAVRRCLEFTAISGVVGDVFEFGVLAGWSARIFAETMRDCMIMGDLRLYDSFAGLPEYDSPVDRESWEIGGRNIWTDKMKFGDDFVATLGGSLEGHIRSRLATILREDRIATTAGFYSDSLRARVRGKAALVHVDCDLYQSTVEVLAALERDDVFQDGCVLMFDDWNCNKGNPWFGERRAFQEFLDRQRRFASTPFFTYGFNGAAFILHERPESLR